MNTPSYGTRSASLLIVALVFFSAFAVGQAMAADPRTPRDTLQPAEAPARLIIRRNPNLGVNVIVRVWIDGHPAGAIAYGHTYDGFLRPGHHVLAALASPNPRWPIPWQVPIDVRSGEIYGFTAVTDGSGTLILDGRFGFPRRVQ